MPLFDELAMKELQYIADQITKAEREGWFDTINYPNAERCRALLKEIRDYARAQTGQDHIRSTIMWWMVEWEDQAGDRHEAMTKSVDSFCDYLDEIGGRYLSKYEVEPGMVFRADREQEQ